MKLLEITYVPIEYKMSVQNAKVTYPQIETSKIHLNQTPCKMEIDNENIKLRLDSSDMRRSLGYKKIDDLSREAPAQTQQTANRVTSEYVNMGNQLTQKGMTIAQLMKQKSLSNITIDTTIGAIPTERIHSSWEPAKTNLKFHRAEVNSDWKQVAREMEFIPSKVTLEIEQLARVDIEYVGGFQYVPESSDPNYEGE